MLSVVVGRRIEENAELLLVDVRDRLGGVAPAVVVSDQYPAYAEARLAVFGETAVPPRTGRPGRPAGPRVVPPEGTCYATVHKHRRRGRVTAVETRVAFGALAPGGPARTSYLERQNATDRHRHARKGRKTYRFRKDWEVHAAVTAFTLDSYNCCWPVRTLRERDRAGRWQRRTPAMAAGLTDHVWTLEEWLTLPGVQRS